MPIRLDACDDFFPPQPEVRAGQLAPGGGPRTVKAQEKAQEKVRQKAREKAQDERCQRSRFVPVGKLSAIHRYGHTRSHTGDMLDDPEHHKPRTSQTQVWAGYID